MRNPLARCIWTRKRVAKLHLDRIRVALLSSRALREESAMNADFELEVRSRDLKGKGSSRRLRRSGKTPAVLYGGGMQPTPITLDNHALAKQMEKEAFFTSILNIVLDGNPQAAVVKEVQRHPFKPQVLHLDFQRILQDEKINLNVPIHFLGEETAKGVTEREGVLTRLVTEVEVTCLPKDLPEFLELDVSELDLNQVLLLSDITLPEGVELVPLSHDQDGPVVGINPARQEEEEEIEVEEDEMLAEGEEVEGSEEEETAEGEEKPKEEPSS